MTYAPHELTDIIVALGRRAIRAERDIGADHMRYNVAFKDHPLADDNLATLNLITTTANLIRKTQP